VRNFYGSEPKTERNSSIRAAHEAGESTTNLAAKYGLTRQRIRSICVQRKSRAAMSWIDRQMVEAHGDVKSVREWSAITGVNTNKVRLRMRRGQSLKEALEL
jgi:hypothetical protein